MARNEFGISIKYSEHFQDTETMTLEMVEFPSHPQWELKLVKEVMVVNSRSRRLNS